MTKRPTINDIRAELDRFIGPPEPYQVPKLIPVSEKARLQKVLDRRLAEDIARRTDAQLRRTSEN